MKFVGYARLARDADDAAMQNTRSRLEAAGCDPRSVYLERTSAASPRGPAFDAALSELRRGDCLVTVGFAGIATNILDLAVVLNENLGVRGVFFRDVDSGIATTTANGKAFVKHLAPLAAFEGKMRAARQAEGIADAKKDGKFRGREPTARQKAGDVIAMREAGLTIAKIAAELSIGEASVVRILRDGRPKPPPPE